MNKRKKNIEDPLPDNFEQMSVESLKNDVQRFTEDIQEIKLDRNAKQTERDLVNE